MCGNQEITPYHNNASKVLPVFVDVHDESTVRSGRVSGHEQLIHVAAVLFPPLAACENQNENQEELTSSGNENENISNNYMNGESLNKLKARPLLGGLSNELFVVENPDNHLSVLIRIHPPGELSDGASESCDRTLINREFENRLLAWLSRSGDAPNFYGRFRNGRVEEFYRGHIPLSCHEMANYAPSIATLMARLHSRQPPSNVFGESSSEENIWNAMKSIDKWVVMAKENVSSFGESDKEQEHEHEGDNLVDLMERMEVQWSWLCSVIRDRAATAACASPLEEAVVKFCGQQVLTHMDCQSLNLLRPEDADNKNLADDAPPSESSLPTSGELKLIDYEYAGINPRAADIANTFCEFCDMNNIRADYRNEYPTDQVQETFFRAYLENTESDGSLISTIVEFQQQDAPSLWQCMRLEIGRYALISHLGWAIWALVQYNKSAIDFDYVAYSKHRMDGYCYFKQKYWNNC